MTTPYTGVQPTVDPAGVLRGVPRLNDTWHLRYAVVTDILSETQAFGRYDGDLTNQVPLIVLNGPVLIGMRVAVFFIPPAGNYVIARVPAGDWFSYDVQFTSSGVAPSVGSDGTLTGRWKIAGQRTITTEVAVVFGASGFTQGTGRYFWSTPFVATDASRLAATGACYIFDSGTANRAAIVNISSGLDQYFVTNTPNGDVGAGVPQAFTTFDQIAFSITHEVASLF